MRSPSLRAAFEAIHAQRTSFFLVVGNLGDKALWRRPADGVWSVGESLDHLYRTMRVYRLAVRVSWPFLLPVAWFYRSQPFERTAVDIFAEREKAGRKMKATLLLRPKYPSAKPSSLAALKQQLEAETRNMEEMLMKMPEGVAGHFRIFDPGVGSPNLIHRVQLLGFHEGHHFRIIHHLLDTENVAH